MADRSGRNPPMWRVLGASVVGTSHLETGRQCDDRHFWQQEPCGLIMAVADGAGSAPRAAEGATAAMAAVADQSLQLLSAADDGDEQTLRHQLLLVVLAARARLEEQAGASAVALGQLATTLSVVAVGHRLVGAVQVGDGAVVLSGGEGLQLLASDRGEYVNETVFVTSVGFVDAASFHIQASVNVSAVAALTDGLQLVALDLATGTPFAPFFEPLFSFAAAAEAGDTNLAGFLGSERLCARTDDDKTLVLAVRQDRGRPE